MVHCFPKSTSCTGEEGRDRYVLCVATENRLVAAQEGVCRSAQASSQVPHRHHAVGAATAHLSLSFTHSQATVELSVVQ